MHSSCLTINRIFYFFDLSNEQNIEREKDIHRQAWSFDYSPLIFIINKTDIYIYNAFSFDKRTDRLQEIKISPEERNLRFSFWNLQTGESWNWLQKEYYKNIHRKRVNQKLFENIKLVREFLTSLKSEHPINDDAANILILRLIFIRYLIDRDVRMDTAYIHGDSIFSRRKSLNELIKDPGKLNRFFGQLNEKFNGVLFKDVNVQLSEEHAAYLFWVFSGRIEPEVLNVYEESDYYFDIFDFSIIPVEVISGIYESLISEETKDEQSAVYTPSFLADYILTETIDKHLRNKSNSDCRVFDPACGSGIFLVLSFRRIVDKEQAKLRTKVKKSRLKEIAQRNLYGIDVNAQALKVSCFSIYIAILDYQDPKTILDNFHFPKLLDENLFKADFFEQDLQNPVNEILKNISFDFILGNVPWKKDKSPKHLSWINASGIYSKQIDGEVEIAQSFLMRSKDFMHPHTVAALIVTSMVVYNVSSTTKEFKSAFLNTFCIDKFFDLSPVRRLIFEEKTSPASIIYYRISDGKEHLKNIVKHVSVKSNIFLKYFKSLVIERFDQKEIKQIHFIENDWMFKVALYGNTLDFVFLKKLEKNRSKLVRLFDGITMFKGAGIHKGTHEKYQSFSPIIGKEIIENTQVNQYFSYTHKPKKILEEESYIKSGKEKGLYEGHQILIKEQAKNESELVISLTDKNYVFRSGVFALSSATQKDEMLVLYSVLLSDLYLYFVFITSGSWGVSTRPQIRLDEELLNFPLAEMDAQTKNKLIELSNQVVAPFKERITNFVFGDPEDEIHNTIKSINELVYSIYGVSGYEADLINYVLNVSRYQFQESKQFYFTQKVDRNIALLTSYAQVFINEFRALYSDEYLQIQVYPLSNFIAMNFVFSKEPHKDNIVVIREGLDEIEILKKVANSLSISQLTNSIDPFKSIYVQKDIKGFEHDSFYIIKPNEFKCWHKAMAWYDVAEIKEAIEAAELDRLKDYSNVS